MAARRCQSAILTRHRIDTSRLRIATFFLLPSSLCCTPSSLSCVCVCDAHYVRWQGVKYDICSASSPSETGIQDSVKANECKPRMQLPAQPHPVCGHQKGQPSLVVLSPLPAKLALRFSTPDLSDTILPPGSAPTASTLPTGTLIAGPPQISTAYAPARAIKSAWDTLPSAAVPLRESDICHKVGQHRWQVLNTWR